MKPLLLALPFLAAAILALGLTPLAKRLAVRLGAMDEPNERKVHKAPIPRLGGVAVVGAFTLVVLAVLAGLLPVPRMPSLDRQLALLVGLLPVFAVSFIDDVHSLRALPRLAAHAVGAVVVLANGYVLPPVVHLFGASVEIGLLAWPLSFLWIVGITNAFNLIDGLDGLAGGLGLISSFSLAGVFLLADHIEVAVVPLALAGALAGFLRYNMHPASIFLGDAGANSVGFVLACLCLRGGTMLSAGLAVLVPVAIVGIPLTDTLVSILRRLVGRLESASSGGVMDADNGHIHHKLVALGVNQRRAVFILYAAAVVTAFVGLGSLFLSSATTGFFLVALFGAAFVGLSRLGYDELTLIRKGTVLRLYDLPALKSGFFVPFVDLVLAILALYFAVGLRWDDWGLHEHRLLALRLGAIVPAVAFLTFYAFGLYKGRWRHAALEDLVRPTNATILTGGAVAVVDLVAFGPGTPLSFFGIFTLVLLFLVTSTRSSYRILAWLRTRSASPGVPVLLYGAGRRGSMAVRELGASADAPLRPIGFVDDDPEKMGLALHGVPVLGSSRDLARLVDEHGARGVIVTSPRIPARAVGEVEDLCAERSLLFFQFNVSFEGSLVTSRDDRNEKTTSGVGTIRE